MRRLLIVMLCLSLVVGCKKDPPTPPAEPMCTVQCTNVPVRVTFSYTNYSPQDLDTVVVWAYVPDSSFAVEESMTIYHLADTVHYTEQTTLGLGTGFNGLELNGQHDYRIAFAGQSFFVYGIEEPNVTEQHPCSENATCRKIINKFAITGGQYQLLAFQDSPLYLLLK